MTFNQCLSNFEEFETNKGMYMEIVGTFRNGRYKDVCVKYRAERQISNDMDQQAQSGR